MDTADGCFYCHERGERKLNDACRSCHVGIDHLLQRGTGLHGLERLTDCSSCHPDHAGLDFDLIEWDEGSAEAFDHRRSGFELEGAHTDVACEACHRHANRGAPLDELIPRRHRRHDWIGLSGECSDCHEDTHSGRLGNDCASCHTSEAFRPARRFDHGTTRFPLTGKHVDLQCNQCHGESGTGNAIGRYAPIPHAQCSACHDDTHDGRLGDDCASCHRTEGFRQIDRAGFDHGVTRFPLRGKHSELSCASCHDPRRAWGKRPRFDNCGTCHQDAHAGTATLRGAPADCGNCHDELSFTTSTYSVTDHLRANYPLEGKHRDVPCRECHTRAGPEAVPQLGSSRVRLRPDTASCMSCHADAHGGQLEASGGGSACEGCHTVDGFKPSTFDLARHNALPFPLQGKHTAASCGACHGPRRRDLPPLPGADVLGSAKIALTTVETRCGSCHFDVHGGALNGGASGCAHCHTPDGFRPADVDSERHRDFAFALEGAHTATPCFECHETLSEPSTATVHLLRVEGILRKLDFVRSHESCENCHNSPHGEQFAASRWNPTCDGCHDLRAFAPATDFDHETESRFPLRGAHQQVACAACHPTRTDRAGRTSRLFRPISTQCSDCHAPGTAGVQEGS